MRTFRAIRPFVLFGALLLAVVCVVPMGCQDPSDPRCRPVPSNTEDDAGPDNTQCCVALRECCDQVPPGNGNPDQDPKLLCIRRADEGAVITCQAEYQILLNAKSCVYTPK